MSSNKACKYHHGPRATLDAGVPRNLLELTRVVQAPRASAPFSIQAIAVEEDTSLVLSADIEIRDPQQHPIRLMTALYAHQPRPPGSIVSKKACPMHLMAIVHDFDQQPSCRDEWITSCLDEIFNFCSRRKITALGLEPLGTQHGRITQTHFQQLLRHSMLANPPSSLRRLWLIGPP